jgi:HK97 family phage major capsid protein
MKRYRKRMARLNTFAVVMLALVSCMVVPALMAGLIAAPKAMAGCAMAMLPLGVILRRQDDEGGGGGGDFQMKVLNGVEALQKSIKAHEDALKKNDGDIVTLQKLANDVVAKMDEFRKAQLTYKQSQRGLVRLGQVSDECARHLGGILVLTGLKQERLSGDRWEGVVKDILGVEARTALTTSDIPLPAGYGSEVVELVSQYSAARKYGTVFPLSNAVQSLPRLKTSPAFGLIAGSATVTEVSPQTEWVVFTAQKFGGLVRFPSEIEEDSVMALGQFIARYAAREMAKVEDHNFFVGTGAGSGANGAVKGLCFSTIDNTKTVTVAAGAGKTAYSDVTLTVIREARALVDAAAIGMGAYYFHPTFEQFLRRLNTAGDQAYVANGINGASLDGFPIRWVDIMPAYAKTANAGKVCGLFGDASYQYLGVRGGFRFDTSKEAGFTTDEILVRALERFTLGLMATGSVAGIATPAN